MEKAVRDKVILFTVGYSILNYQLIAHNISIYESFLS